MCIKTHVNIFYYTRANAVVREYQAKRSCSEVKPGQYILSAVLNNLYIVIIKQIKSINTNIGTLSSTAQYSTWKWSEGQSSILSKPFAAGVQWPNFYQNFFYNMGYIVTNAENWKSMLKTAIYSCFNPQALKRKFIWQLEFLENLKDFYWKMLLKSNVLVFSNVFHRNLI